MMPPKIPQDAEKRAEELRRALDHHNYRYYVLDHRGLPTPTGVPGELNIAADGIARGYLNKPGLTAEMFVPDSYSNRAGARMYRSGDLVRILRDGIPIYSGPMESLRHHKDDVREARSGTECGIRVANYDDYKVGDLLESYIIEEHPDTL